MNNINSDIALRLKGLRELSEISAEDMADKIGIDIDSYREFESGNKDFTFTLLYNCAGILGVTINEIITGESPRLSSYSIERAGSGMEVARRQGFNYLHIASRMKNRIAEPFIVTAPYIEAEQDKPITTSTHIGQEMDYVLEGSLKCVIDGHVEILHEGDTLYYDSSLPHGMIATGGKPCKFIAIVMKR